MLCNHCGNEIDLTTDYLKIGSDENTICLCQKCSKGIKEQFSETIKLVGTTQFPRSYTQLIDHCKARGYDTQIIDAIKTHINRSTDLGSNTESENPNTSSTTLKSRTMFDNIDKKLMKYAKFFCYFGIIVFGYLGLACIVAAIGSKEYTFIVYGIVFAPLCIFLSWISSLILYGFGKLIENSKKIVELLSNK